MLPHEPLDVGAHGYDAQPGLAGGVERAGDQLAGEPLALELVTDLGVEEDALAAGVDELRQARLGCRRP